MEQKSGCSKDRYLLPIFFGILGGTIMFATLRKGDYSMTKKGLILGIILDALSDIVWACNDRIYVIPALMM